MSYLPASASPAAQSLVLIAEDEAEIADILAAYLQRHGLRTLHAADGREALAMHQAFKPDLLLLDVQMPQLDCWQVLSEIRARGDTPVIMLTALDQDLDKLMGLRMGADDYVVKPFSVRELMLRVKAVLRRSQNNQPAAEQQLIVGELVLDFQSYTARIGDQRLALTPKEYELLKLLVTNPGRAFLRDELLERIWGYEYYGDTRTVDVHIRHLRAKLAAAPELAAGIETVRGIGYRFVRDL